MPSVPDDEKDSLLLLFRQRVADLTVAGLRGDLTQEERQDIHQRELEARRKVRLLRRSFRYFREKFKPGGARPQPPTTAEGIARNAQRQAEANSYILSRLIKILADRDLIAPKELEDIRLGAICHLWAQEDNGPEEDIALAAIVDAIFQRPK